jgi:hypothetical protein|uniref:Uncharacterized protein n=1 Tax=Siphoviridae sp. ctEJG5 TaxID=2827814 RepID=A0A8S5RXG2_9CAUD|nr:MAG TPA: hypothetical protein [Siphoviridae sp. ctEJG5]
MAKIEIKDGKIFSENDYRTDVFEIVEKIPENYVVWNIGENMGTDKYIPICQLKTKYDVDLFSLKAVPVTSEEYKRLQDASSWGVSSLENAEKALKSKRRGYISDKKRVLAASVIEIFRKISAFQA